MKRESEEEMGRENEEEVEEIAMIAKKSYRKSAARKIEGEIPENLRGFSKMAGIKKIEVPLRRSFFGVFC